MADTETDSTTGESSNFPTFHSRGTGDNGIEGDIHIPVPSDDEDELNTLDEPVSETLVCICTHQKERKTNTAFAPVLKFGAP